MNHSREEVLLLYYGFVPSTSVCIFALIVSCVLVLVQIAQGTYYKQWWFAITWFLGLALQAVGYGARLGTILYPREFAYFAMQITCLVISPGFLVAGIYYQLAKVVTIYGQEFSHFRPKTYTCLLIACDFFAISVQIIGAGVALSNPSTHAAEVGRYIVLAGLSIQVFSMVIFIVLFAMIALRIYRSSPTNYEFDWYEVRQRPLFALFIPVLMVSMLLIFGRSLYRMIQLSQGYSMEFTPPEHDQLVFDGLLVLLATLLLTVIHPGICLGREQIPIDPPREEQLSEFNDK